MSVSTKILNKIKMLRNLSTSSNEHESKVATTLVEQLMQKYQVSEEDLRDIEDQKPIYGEDERLFSTIEIVGWMQQLAVTIGNYFDCQIVQEEMVPLDGPHTFNYYVYGEVSDTNVVKFTFNALVNQIKKMVEINCTSRGSIYISSYSEGITDAIKQNIWTDGIHLPDKQVPVRVIPTTDDTATKPDQITKPKEDKVRADKHVDVRSQSMVKDIMAYFKGIEDGKDLSLSNVLETADQDGTNC